MNIIHRSVTHPRELNKEISDSKTKILYFRRNNKRKLNKKANVRSI